MSEAVVSTLYIKNLNERVPRHRLRQRLLDLCERHGNVVSVNISRGVRKRGQAFIAFRSAEQAQSALGHLNQTDLFHKKMEVFLAKSNSEALMSPEARSALRMQQESSAHTKHDINQTSAKSSSQPLKSSVNKPTTAKSFGEPHNLLLLQHIPDSVTVDSLRKLCAEFAGFKEARMFAVRHIGFVEFENLETASAAIDKISELGVGAVTYAKK